MYHKTVTLTPNMMLLTLHPKPVPTKLLPHLHTRSGLFLNVAHSVIITGSETKNNFLTVTLRLSSTMGRWLKGKYRRFWSVPSLSLHLRQDCSHSRSLTSSAYNVATSGNTDHSSVRGSMSQSPTRVLRGVEDVVCLQSLDLGYTGFLMMFSFTVLRADRLESRV